MTKTQVTKWIVRVVSVWTSSGAVEHHDEIVSAQVIYSIKRIEESIRWIVLHLQESLSKGAVPFHNMHILSSHQVPQIWTIVPSKYQLWRAEGHVMNLLCMFLFFSCCWGATSDHWIWSCVCVCVSARQQSAESSLSQPSNAYPRCTALRLSRWWRCTVMGVIPKLTAPFHLPTDVKNTYLL